MGESVEPFPLIRCRFGFGSRLTCCFGKTQTDKPASDERCLTITALSTTYLLVSVLALSSCTHLAPSRTTQFHAAHIEDMAALCAIPDADINLPTHNGTTLLMAAARNGKLKSVEYLLTRKADATLLDVDQQSALHYSLNAKMKAVDEALIVAGGDPSQADRFDVTPVLEWAERGDFDLVRLGLENSEHWSQRNMVRKELKQLISNLPPSAANTNKNIEAVQKLLLLP